MRYKCVGSPQCMKTFEHGHALRAHIGACVEAQKILKSRGQTEKLEHEVGVEYAGIQGLHTNTYYPIACDTDQTNKYQFKDRFRFNGVSSKPETFNNQDMLRPQRMKTMFNLQRSSQVQQALNFD